MKESTINSLLEWAKKEGAMLDMIDVRYCGEDRGFGVFARRMIRVHEVFLRIPKHLMITAGLVAEMPAYKEILERHRLEAFPILVLFFYLEAKNLQNSFFKPYFMSLPKSFDTPLAYNNSTVEENIKMDQLPNRAKELLIKQQNEFTYIREQLSRALDNTNLDMDHLNWAWHVVNTRCVYSENPEHP
ncbi:unnamed protein product [Bursaphelenchus okinawaensis]|uniref:Uncharacterized protein n=1 Tax=Bursaphelenchus okinawaensis TaxID=465554 RepID=A0A811JRJ9_9BILA|nr:unnamed protein product [Bursaphelenchus okinawaensis]CAG9079607.1 unnamed protein product [Bursaphelenchus okinawaensis]